MLTVKRVLPSEVLVPINQDTSITSHSTVNLATICVYLISEKWSTAYSQRSRGISYMK